MTARSEAVSKRAFHGRRRVSDVAREHGSDKAANKSQQRPKRGSSSKSGQRRSKRHCNEQKPCCHLDYGALIHVFKRCEGISRVTFGLVSKLWSKVQREASTHHVNGSKELRNALEEGIKSYDTIILVPGMYKERVLCEAPVRLLGGTAATPAAPAPATPTPKQPTVLDGDAVIFWQERAPAILVNADACYFQNIFVRVVHANHEYSCIAYGPSARSITLDGCSIMGGTGLRIPYSVDPLRVLLLSMYNCVVQDVKGGLSGITAVSGQLEMHACTVHDCTYGLEVGVDAHACVSNSSICFTECALMCEGHMALTACKIWGNVATWHGRPLVMEDDVKWLSIEPRAARRGSGLPAAAVGDSLAETPLRSCAGTADAATQADASRNVCAGICNGRRIDCMVAGEAGLQTAGVRHHAQVRLNGCDVDYERLKSAVAQDNVDLQRHHRHIRRLMRETYGPPDQDFEDWQVIVMSDMESDGSDDADVVMNSDDEESDGMPVSSDDDDDSSDDDDDEDSDSDDVNGMDADESSSENIGDDP